MFMDPTCAGPEPGASEWAAELALHALEDWFPDYTPEQVQVAWRRLMAGEPLPDGIPGLS